MSKITVTLLDKEGKQTILEGDGSYKVVESPESVKIDVDFRPVVDFRHLMKITDATTSDGYGMGVTAQDYWRTVIRNKGSLKGLSIGSTSLLPRVKLPQGTEVLLDVTEAVKTWQKAPLDHYGVYLESGANCNFFSKESNSDPVLKVWYEDGATDILVCLADSSLNSSTTKTLGGAATLNVGRAVIRFDIDRLQQKPVKKAEISLIVSLNYSTSVQTLTAYEVVPPVVMNPPTIRDFYNDNDLYFKTATVGKNPAESPYEKYLNYEVQNPALWKKASWPEDYLRVHWTPKFRSGSFGIPIFRGHTNQSSDPTEGRVVTYQYSIRLAANFGVACREGGKFPGFCSAGAVQEVKGPAPWPGMNPYNKIGVLYAGNGGGWIRGYDGWSARGGYLPRVVGAGHPAAGYTPLHTYAYYLSQKQPDGRIALYHEILKRYEAKYGPSGTRDIGLYPGLLNVGEYVVSGVSGTGDRLEWDYGAPSGLLRPEQWHTVTQEMRINTPGMHDGYIKAYVDGRLVGVQEGLCWRSTETPRPQLSTLGIACVWFNFYHGGTLFPVVDTYFDVKNIAVKVLEWDD